MNTDNRRDEPCEQSITPESKLPICILRKSGTLHWINSPLLNFEEAKQFLHDLGIGAFYIGSGEYFWEYGPEEGDFEPINAWIGRSREE